MLERMTTNLVILLLGRMASIIQHGSTTLHAWNSCSSVKLGRKGMGMATVSCVNCAKLFFYLFGADTVMRNDTKIMTKIKRR